MGSLITFCVLLIHFGFSAAFPFPEGYNLAYQQPQFKFQQGFAQPQAQHYGNVASYQQNPSIVQYQSNPTQQRFNYDRNYNIYPTEPQTLVTEITKQEEERIEEEIKKHQAYNDNLANKLIIQNAQQQQNTAGAVPQSYQQVNAYPVSPSDSLYYPMQQHLPNANSPSQWASEENGYAPVQTTSRTIISQPAQEGHQTRLTNPFQTIYHHFANALPDQQQPIHWQNFWRKYSDSSLPPKRDKKRYLVIHPDGRTEYVDHLEQVAKKHPNYVLFNAGSILKNQANPSEASPDLLNGSPLPQSQPEILPPKPKQAPNQPATSITETAPNNPPPQNPIAPIASPLPPPTPLQSRPVNEPNPIPPTTQISVQQPTPVPQNTPEPTTGQPITPNAIPTSPPTNFDGPKAVLPPLLPTPGTAASPIANPTFDSPNKQSPPTTPPEPAGLPTDIFNPTTSKPDAPTETPKPEDSPSTLDSTTPILPAPIPGPVLPPLPIAIARKPETTTEQPTPDSPITQSTLDSPATRTALPNPTQPSLSESNIPSEASAPTDKVPITLSSNPAADNNPTTPKPEAPNSPAKLEESTTPEIPPPGPLNLSEINTNETITLFKTSDWDMLRKLFGDDKYIYFINVLSSPVVERDNKTTTYPDGSQLEEVVEKVKDSECAEPKVTKRVKLIPAEGDAR